MRRWMVVAGALALLVAGCGDDGGTSTLVSAVAGATYSGPVVPQSDLTGRVTVDVSADGTAIVGLILAYEMTDYSCGDGITITGPGAYGPMDISIPLVGPSFLYESSVMRWEGTFATSTSAEGTVEGNLISPDCDFGPLSWTVELREEPADDPTTSSPTVPPSASGDGEFSELCEVNRRFLERAEGAAVGAEFWESQRDDAGVMVGLAPAEIQGDMAIRADAWRRFVDVLGAYDYDFAAMVDAVGTQPYDDIFLDEAVVAASARITEFIDSSCG